MEYQRKSIVLQVDTVELERLSRKRPWKNMFGRRLQSKTQQARTCKTARYLQPWQCDENSRFVRVQIGVQYCDANSTVGPSATSRCQVGVV
eukprot:6190562-Pleurochrysis_carterae.AAC.1